MGRYSRLPNSNELPNMNDRKKPWLEENEIYDEVCLLLNGMAIRCATCKKATRTKYLDTKLRCPDCQ